jgi:hypothetical protein
MRQGRPVGRERVARHMIREPLSGVKGAFRAQQVIELPDGSMQLAKQAPGSALAELARRGLKYTPVIEKNNLVVTAGRSAMVHELAGDGTRRWIDRVQLGDAKVNGVVSKDTFPPDLSDNRLLHEIRTLAGAPGATFELDGFEFPAEVEKTAPAGLPGTLTAGVVSILSDPGADFIADGVTDADVAVVFINGEDFKLGIRSIISATQLEVENPSQLAAAGISYKVTTPGGQVLFRKLVSGNNFPESNYGPLTVAHEAGLLFTDSTLFNRVIFAPGNPNVGLTFQPRDVDGLTLSAQLDWLITI